MLSPITTVFIYFPLRAFVTIVLMALVSALIYRSLNKKCKNKVITKQNSSSCWLLTTYSEILLYLTVFGRRSLDYYRYNFDVGYSYREVFVMRDYTLASQIFVNIVMFVPIGILCGLVVKRLLILKSSLYGIFLSTVIEILQLVLRRGYCEWDDLVSNFIGTAIGCLLISIYRLLARAKEKS